MFWGNGRLISVWPVRSSILVDGDSVFWTAGLFPREGMYVCKRNALDGTGGWTKPAPRPSQGYLVAGSKALYAPGGKGVSKGTCVCVYSLNARVFLPQSPEAPSALVNHK